MTKYEDDLYLLMVEGKPLGCFESKELAESFAKIVTGFQKVCGGGPPQFDFHMVPFWGE